MVVDGFVAAEGLATESGVAGAYIASSNSATANSRPTGNTVTALPPENLAESLESAPAIALGWPGNKDSGNAR